MRVNEGGTDVNSDDPEDDMSDEQLWLDLLNEASCFDTDDEIYNGSDSSSDEDSINSEQGESESSESSDSSGDEDEEITAQLAAKPLVAEAPRILEPCLHIDKIPGVGEFKTSSFRLCGDNIDKTIRRRFLRSDNSNTSLHYFHSYAVLNRVDFSHLSDHIPDNSTITDLESVAISIQPTKIDDKILQGNIATLISRVLCTKMDFFKFCFEDIVQWHIEHKYTSEMSQKSVVVSFLSCIFVATLLCVCVFLRVVEKKGKKKA